MDLAELAVAGDVNLAHAWAVLGGHAHFDVTSIDSVTLVASSLPIAFFNGAFAVEATSEPEATVAAALAFFADRDVPYLLWVRDTLDEDLLTAGRRAGLRDAGGPPAMGLATIGDIPPSPPGLELTLATGRDDVDLHREVAVAGFGMPPEVAERMVAYTLVTDPDIAIVIGRVGGLAVTTAVLALSDDTAGIYNVATVPQHRGKGYGEAATWAAVAEGARRGCTHSVLQASDTGYPIYRRMGYVDLGRYVQLQGPPTV